MDSIGHEPQKVTGMLPNIYHESSTYIHEHLYTKYMHAVNHIWPNILPHKVTSLHYIDCSKSTDSSISFYNGIFNQTSTSYTYYSVYS